MKDRKLLLSVIKRSICEFTSASEAENHKATTGLCTLSVYFFCTCHIIRHIYAPILLTFHLFLNTNRQHPCKQPLEVSRRRKTVHTIGIEHAQTGPNPLRHVNHSRSATEAERNWDVIAMFLSVWTTPYNYAWENFAKRWRSMTERKRDA
jgi:hypothetical protein